MKSSISKSVAANRAQPASIEGRIDIVVKDAQGQVVYRTHYIYDVLDRRIATEVDADGDGPQSPVRTWTFYDGDNPYIDLDDQGNVQQYYLYGPDIDQLLARLDPETGMPE